VRPLALLYLLAAVVRADDFVFEDELWNLAYTAPGLEATLATKPAELFRGMCDDGLRVTVTVYEDLTEKEWRRRFGKRNVTKNRVLFTEKKLGVFESMHGYALQRRGVHCFEVHAWIDDRKESSEQDIRAALGGLALGDDPGCGLAVRRVAGRLRKPPLHPQVLLAAGLEYLKAARPALASPILERARKREDAASFEKGQRWQLLRFGGEAHLRAGRAKLAADWLAEAERVATEERAAGSAYALARACAAAGRIDAAFAALDRAFAGAPPVGKGALSKEKTLEPLRRDARWEEFWKRRVR